MNTATGPWISASTPPVLTVDEGGCSSQSAQVLMLLRGHECVVGRLYQEMDWDDTRREWVPEGCPEWRYSSESWVVQPLMWAEINTPEV